MGKKRKEKTEEGRPLCRHAGTKIWSREKKSSSVQTQTFTTSSDSGVTEASVLYSNNAGFSNFSSSKWHDLISGVEDARCNQTNSEFEQVGYVEDNSGRFAKSCQNCELKDYGSSRPSSSSNHHEKRIYLHLDFRNRESPQLVVCPKRNHHQYYSSGHGEVVIDVDSESLPRPSCSPSRSRLCEHAMPVSSFTQRSNCQSYTEASLYKAPQLQSLLDANGSGSRSTSENVPSPTASINPRRGSQVQNAEGQLTHERAMLTTPERGRSDLRSNLAHGRAMSEPRGRMAFRGCELDICPNQLAQGRHSLSSPACSECSSDPKSQFEFNIGEGVPTAKIGNVREILLPLPKFLQKKNINTPNSGTRVVKAIALQPKPATYGKIATPRSCSMKLKRDTMRVKGGSGAFPTIFPNWFTKPVESSAPPQQTDGVVLSWENLTVMSKVGKVLLNNLNGQIICGFTAIMGPSGSGKSTLLNTLACRMRQSASVTGRILLNGRDYKIADLKKISGYVMQDDLLHAHLTVEETLKYTTRLKLEPSLTEEEVSARVDEIITQMGLDHVRNTVIGNPEKRGISGGERRRVSVGMELVTHPQLLFLDEPTSGLDSVTALSLCEQLQKLARSANCTIVCTIHQPQAKIFNLFHYLIILKAGQVNMNQGSEYLVFQTMRERMPWHRQYLVLLNRGVREQIRKKNMLITQMCQSVMMGLLIGGVFFQIGDHQKSTVRRQPVLFFCVINQGVFGALTVINSFPGERALTLRERAAGMYYCSSYFTAKVTAEMVSQIVSPIIFSFIVYWMVGFQRNGSKFMIFMVLMVLCQLAATSLALMVSAICRTTDFSVTVLPMVLEVNRLFGGFFLSPKNLPDYFVWLDAFSYVKYTYTAISLNELHGLKIRCSPSEYVAGACPITSGEQTIKSLGLDYLNIGSCITILIFYILITRIIAYLGIRYLKK
uniref:ABC transporter domain-containing protein n=1 Tax=Physcomitrium patens TaxID=3218 RepID=A0A7I4AWE4_PHYPA